MSECSTDKLTRRRSMYGGAELSDRRPGRVNQGEQHTMRRENFLKYIGMDSYAGETNNFFLSTKKFSRAQSKLILRAFTEKLPVHVLGAYRDDIRFIAEKNDRAVDDDTNIRKQATPFV